MNDLVRENRGKLGMTTSAAATLTFCKTTIKPVFCWHIETQRIGVSQGGPGASCATITQL